MAARKLPEAKAAAAMIDACADTRLNLVAFAHIIQEEDGEIQRVFYNLLVAYVWTMAGNYESGRFPNSTYEIARLCKKIKDFALNDELKEQRYEKYGDYEKAIAPISAPDLTEFDKK